MTNDNAPAIDSSLAIDRSRGSTRPRETVLEEVRNSTGETQMLARLLVDRFSCRAYLPDPVADVLIDQILAIAQLTASWCNTQPWEVRITRGGETGALSDALSRAVEADPAGQPDMAFPASYLDIYDKRRKVCGGQLFASLGIDRANTNSRNRLILENFRFFGAPHVAIISHPAALGGYGAVDCGGYVTTFMLAARTLGIDTTPQAALALQSSTLRRELAIPNDRILLCGISFGYADTSHSANLFRTERARP